MCGRGVGGVGGEGGGRRGGVSNKLLLEKALQIALDEKQPK